MTGNCDDDSAEETCSLFKIQSAEQSEEICRLRKKIRSLKRKLECIGEVRNRRVQTIETCFPICKCRKVKRETPSCGCEDDDDDEEEDECQPECSPPCPKPKCKKVIRCTQTECQRCTPVCCSKIVCCKPRCPRKKKRPCRTR